jgi:predicted nucleic acid-binding protein
VLVADTGAVLALVDRSDAHHAEVRAIYAEDPDAWVLPWAILPEVDYLLATHVGPRAQWLWFDDIATGAFTVDWNGRDLAAAHAIADRYADIQFGLVDAVVMATAERLRSDIVTLDLRHFGVVRLAHGPRLLPRDGMRRAAPRRR